MDANAQYELYLIKKELQDIATELDNIANGVRRDFIGIGNDKCANSISSSVKHYRDVKAQLEKMDLSALNELMKCYDIEIIDKFSNRENEFKRFYLDAMNDIISIII